MTIHTFSTTALLKKKIYYQIEDDLKRDKSSWQAEKTGMFYFGLADNGILIRLAIVKSKTFRCHVVQYIISAQRVLTPGHFVALFDSSKYKALKKKVNRLLYSKSTSLPKLNKTKLNRLDFCINAYMNSQEQVKAFIKLVQRAVIPHDMVRSVFYDKKAKRTKPGKDDFSFHSAGSIDNVEVSIYNKLAQMKKQTDYHYSDIDLEAAKNIVRIEIRCKSEKIKSLEKANKITKIKQFMAHADQIGRELFTYYLSDMFGPGCIRTVKEAKEWIQNSDFTAETKNSLLQYIGISDNLRSTAEAFAALTDKKDEKQIKKHLAEIDTNYVTIPREESKLFPKHEIPTPLSLFEQAMKNNTRK